MDGFDQHCLTPYGKQQKLDVSRVATILLGRQGKQKYNRPTVFLDIVWNSVARHGMEKNLQRIDEAECRLPSQHH